MLNNFASTQAGGVNTVTTTTILDGTIANADVATDAAIAVSKIDFGNTLEIETSSCLLYTSPSPRDRTRSRMPSSA